jgi:ABC-type Fe3+-citrate transport system substrate-binding protein
MIISNINSIWETSSNKEKNMEEQIDKHEELLSNWSMTELRFSVKHSAATIPTQETKKYITETGN